MYPNTQTAHIQMHRPAMCACGIAARVRRDALPRALEWLRVFGSDRMVLD